MKKISEFQFQLYVIFNADIEQNDPFIKKMKNKIYIKIKRVSQMYKLNEINVNLKK